MNQLQSIEGHCKQLLQALQCDIAHEIMGKSDEERRRWLAKKTITVLQAVLDGKDVRDAVARPDYKAGPGSPSNEAAMSLDASGLTHEDRVVNSLTHAMGVYVPREYR